jgi:hypothetical protein
VLDAHADEAFGNGNGVFGNELLERDEEASLDGNAAGDSSGPDLVSIICVWWRVALLPQRAFGQDEEADRVEQICEDVGYHGHEEHELGEFVRPPGSFQVATAVEDGEASGDEAEDILLHHCRQSKDPRIPGHRMAGNDGEPGHAVSHADDWLLDLFHPVGVGAQCEVDESEEDDGSEDTASERGEVDAGHGGSEGV